MLQTDAIEIWKAGVAAVHGRTLIERALKIQNNTLHIAEEQIDLDRYDRILVVGGGKFSHFMAEGLENVLGESLSKKKQLSGLVTVPDGSNAQVNLGFIESAECRPAGINLPTQRVVDATERMLGLLKRCDDRTLVIALISGGGSALLERSELPLIDIIAATNWLSSRGANILELNTVRIALSDVKGGGLARAMPNGKMIGLIVSDVPGDDLRFVSSGPTVDFGDDLSANARDVLKRFDAKADSSFPMAVFEYIAKDFEHSVCADVKNVLIGDARVALSAAGQKATELGYELLPDALANTVTCADVASAASSFVHGGSNEKQCVISLGEPVVSPGEGAGQGGRNQHSVLLAIDKLVREGCDNEFCFLSGGTDGEDGNTAVAGAYISNHEIQAFVGLKSAIKDCLDRFDSHSFLSKHGLVFDSGPTGTNVADLRILLRS